MENFLPENYNIPTTSRYMKFQDGVNVFRILDKPIFGMEYWKTKEDGTRYPVRKRMGVKIDIAELEINPKSGKIEGPQHFWAMPVYNYQEKAIQILEIKQITIIKTIKSYIENPKWGNPMDYDITINKSGAGLTTEYMVDHDPKEAIAPSIQSEYESMDINLEALFDGEDPFSESTLSKEAKRLGVEEGKTTKKSKADEPSEIDKIVAGKNPSGDLPF